MAAGTADVNAKLLKQRLRAECLKLLCELQERKCAYCGKHMSRKRRIDSGCARIVNPRRATIDHVVPLALGGKDDLSNFVAVHQQCNIRKGGRCPTSEEFAAAARVQELVQAHLANASTNSAAA